jgi:DNA-directed RNA polymerase specialized sigma24 family protein
MDPVSTDAELIAASFGDPARFAELFDRHFAAVHRFAERRVGRDQAGEVASETLTRAFTRRGSYRLDVPDARPWLYGIASNLILHERRRFVRYVSAVERVGTDRELLLLVAWDELSYEEAAAALGLPVGTVRSKLHRAEARLRELLAASGRTPADRHPCVPKEALSP